MPSASMHTPERLLDLNDVLTELVKQGRIDQDMAENCLAARRGDAATVHLHPLEYIANQQLNDLTRAGRKLDLETLTDRKSTRLNSSH